MIKTLFVFRHGETDWNRAGRMQGGTDIPLNEAGRLQALILRDFFVSNPVDVFLSSDLSRARETAEIANTSLGVPVILEPRLRETNMGLAEGLTTEQVSERFGAQLLEEWRSIDFGGSDVRFPSGETKAEHLARVLEGLTEFLSSTTHSRIAVATHGGVMRRLIHHLIPKLKEPIFVGNCVVYRLTYSVHQKFWEIEPEPVCGKNTGSRKPF